MNLALCTLLILVFSGCVSPRVHEDVENAQNSVEMTSTTSAPPKASDEGVSGEGNPCEGLSLIDCEEDPGCYPSWWVCDWVPEGKTFDDVCPDGGKGFECRQK